MIPALPQSSAAQNQSVAASKQSEGSSQGPNQPISISMIKGAAGRNAKAPRASRSMFDMATKDATTQSVGVTHPRHANKKSPSLSPANHRPGAQNDDTASASVDSNCVRAEHVSATKSPASLLNERSSVWPEASTSRSPRKAFMDFANDSDDSYDSTRESIRPAQRQRRSASGTSMYLPPSSRTEAPLSSSQDTDGYAQDVDSYGRARRRDDYPRFDSSPQGDRTARDDADDHSTRHIHPYRRSSSNERRPDGQPSTSDYHSSRLSFYAQHKDPPIESSSRHSNEFDDVYPESAFNEQEPHSAAMSLDSESYLSATASHFDLTSRADPRQQASPYRHLNEQVDIKPTHVEDVDSTTGNTAYGRSLESQSDKAASFKSFSNPMPEESKPPLPPAEQKPPSPPPTQAPRSSFALPSFKLTSRSPERKPHQWSQRARTRSEEVEEGQLSPPRKRRAEELPWGRKPKTPKHDHPSRPLLGPLHQVPMPLDDVKLLGNSPSDDSDVALLGASELLKTYKKQEKLGEGTFGVVWKGTASRSFAPQIKRDGWRQQAGNAHLRMCSQGQIKRHRVNEGDVVALKQILHHEGFDGVSVR